MVNEEEFKKSELGADETFDSLPTSAKRIAFHFMAKAMHKYVDVVEQRSYLVQQLDSDECFQHEIGHNKKLIDCVIRRFNYEVGHVPG